MTERNAVIKSAVITNDDHGILTAWLHVDYGGAGQGFGGYALYSPKLREAPYNYTGLFLWRVMETVGVHNWGDLVGKPIRVRQDHSQVTAIGHYIEDKWFDAAVEMKAAQAEAEGFRR